MKKSIVEMLSEKFEATTQEERDRYMEKTPKWLQEMRKNIYIDREGKINYKSK